MKICTPAWAVEVAACIGAEIAERIGTPGVRGIGDPALLSAVPAFPDPVPRTSGIDAKVAAHVLYGTLAVTAADPLCAAVRTVRQASSKELVRVPGHRFLRRLKTE